MAFTELETCIANTKIWKKDLAADKPPENVEDLFNWMLSQFLNNLAPLLESQARANMEELGEAFEAIEAQGDAIDTLIEQEGDFLQPEMASNLTATLLIGMFIVDAVDDIVLDDDLKNKKLQDAKKLYRQNTTILLEQIEAVTVEDDEGDDKDDNDDTDDDTDEDTTPGKIIHGEGEGDGGGSESGDGRDGSSGAIGSGGGDDDGSGSGDRSTGSGGSGVLAGSGDTGAGAGDTDASGSSGA